MKKVFFLLMMVFLIIACSKDNILDSEIDIPDIDDTGQVLKLSVAGHVTTDKFDFEFDILSGNGEYEITISDESAAKATIEGSKVTIHLLKRDVSLAVSDNSDQSVSLIIMSSTKELIPNSYTLLLPKDKSHTMDIGFGVGGYKIESIKGSSATSFVTEDDNIKVTANTVGNSYFMLTDKRGSTAPLAILVPSYYDLLVNENLKITASNDERVNITLKRSEGDWSFVNKPSSPLIIDATLLSRANFEMKNDILQFDTHKDGLKGSTTIYLKDSLGNRASVTVEVK